MPLGGKKKKRKVQAAWLGRAVASAKQDVNQTVRAGHQSRSDTGVIIPKLKDGFEEGERGDHR